MLVRPLLVQLFGFEHIFVYTFEVPKVFDGIPWYTSSNKPTTSRPLLTAGHFLQLTEAEAWPVPLIPAPGDGRNFSCALGQPQFLPRVHELKIEQYIYIYLYIYIYIYLYIYR